MTSGPDPLQIAVIVGSTRDGRFAPVVTEWFLSRLRRRSDMNVDHVDLRQVDLPATLAPAGAIEGEARRSLEAVSGRLAAADGFVVVTPEYNHSFPAPLKAAIDWYKSEWHAKPVGFVSYGGISGGLRAVEQLRLVFAEVHAVTIRDSVSIAYARTKFRDGQSIDPAGMDTAAEILLERLAWWAHALRDARARRPYPEQL